MAEAGVAEGVATAEAEGSGISTVEGANAGLTDSVVETAVNGDRAGWLPIDDGNRRRGGTVNIGDGLPGTPHG